MRSELVVGVVASPRSWRRALQAHVSDHVAAVRLVVVHDAAEALKAGLDVIVVDDALDFLTPVQASALRDHGVRLVGVYDPTGREGRGRAAVAALGADSLVAATDGPMALMDVLATTPVAARPRSNGTVAAAAPAPDDPDRGRVVVVAGGSDAPGRTETAIGIAQAIAVRGESTVLLDLDDEAPSVARRLGFRLVPGLIDAIIEMDSGGSLAACVGHRADFAKGHVAFDTICGLPNPRDWDQVRDVPRLLDTAATGWRWVVVDTGPSCDTLEVAGKGLRHATTRSALAVADHLVAVSTGSPLGVLRLLDWASVAAEVIDRRPMIVALNRAPRDRFSRGQLRGQILAHLPERAVESIEFLDEDPAVAEAVWNAAPVKAGPFTAAVQRLVDHVAPAPKPRGRRLRIGVGRRG